MSDISALLEGQFGMTDISFAGIDAYTKRDSQTERKLLKFLITQDAHAYPLELLQWGLLRTGFLDEAEFFEKPMKAFLGENYARYRSAVKCAYVVNIGKEPDAVNAIYNSFVKNDLSITEEDFHLHFMDCRGTDAVVQRIELYRMLTKDSLTDFYKRMVVPLTKIGTYDLVARMGYYEHSGGFCIELEDSGKWIMQVGGRLDNCTNVIAVHGGRDFNNPELIQEKINGFRELTDMHPANFLLLLYLKIGQQLRHTTATIAGSASMVQNNQELDSKLYEIPRNYFRLRMDPASGKYQLDVEVRDKILQKFSAINPALNSAFGFVEEWIPRSTSEVNKGC